MPYISELLDNKVRDSSDFIAGRLEDILISPKNGYFSPLKFLVVKTALDKQTKFVSFDFVQNFSDTEITLKNLFNTVALSELPKEPFVYLKREVLDRQIVDLAGTRVVRVDDLRIGNFEGQMCVLGIDTSFRGLLRRLGPVAAPFARFFNSRLIDWRHAQLLGGGPLQLNALAENFKKLHPADLANIVEELDVKRGSSLLSSLDAREAAKVLEELDPRLQNIFVNYLGPEKASKILAQMSSDDIVDLIKTFSEPEARIFLAEISGGKAQSIQKLISYGDNTAGGLMTLDFVAVRPEATVKEALDEIKKQSPAFRSIFFVYVTGQDGKFEGVVSLRRLLVAEPEAVVKKLAKNFRTPALLRPADSIRKIIKVMTRYNLYTAAVVDKEKKLVGVVTIDDVMRRLFPTA